MRRTRVTFIALLISLILLTVFVVFAIGAGTEEEPLEERVANLEIQVSDLQARIIRLEKQSAQSSPTLPFSSQNIGQTRAAWRSLQKGMSRSQVRSILGEPKDIDMFSSFEVWHYAKSAMVNFDRSGTVDGWHEPSD